MRDYVLCFFSAPPKSAAWYSIAQPLDLLNEPPVVVSWGPGAGWSTIEQYRGADGRLLPGLLASLGVPAGDVRRLAMISFSAGRQAAQRVLQHADDRAQLDIVLDLDGLHSAYGDAAHNATIAPWVAYAQSAFDASRLLVMCHTAIVPPGYSSTTVMNRALFDAIAQAAQGAALGQQTWLQAELERLPPPPATISNQGRTKTWETFPELNGEVYGNCFRWGMPGNEGVDHIFCAGYLQGAIWRAFIVPRWNNETVTTWVDPEKLRVNGGASGQGSPPQQGAPETPPEPAQQSTLDAVLEAGGWAITLGLAADVLLGLSGFFGRGLLGGPGR